MNIAQLAAWQEKPPLFAPGEVRFWDDPHIATQMLIYHLSPDTDAASNRPEKIDRIVAWLVEHLDMQPDMALLDLGCGPGLYSRRFSQRGLRVTGVDLSQNSLNYARQHDSATTYLQQNYLELDVDGPFDVVTLIAGDLCVLTDEKRDTLLGYIKRLLKPGGHFVFDVTTRQNHQPPAAPRRWGVMPAGGFWRPGPYLELYHFFDYPEHDAALEQYIIIEDGGWARVYRNWIHYYSPETISAVLNAQDFEVMGVYGDLAGTPYTPESGWVGVVARWLGV